jgi:hypothetical protein
MRKAHSFRGGMDSNVIRIKQVYRYNINVHLRAIIYAWIIFIEQQKQPYH